MITRLAVFLFTAAVDRFLASTEPRRPRRAPRALPAKSAPAAPPAPPDGARAFAVRATLAAATGDRAALAALLERYAPPAGR